MITVYAETSFVMAHAHHEDLASTQALIDGARKKQIRLAVPMLSLFEALYRWRGQQKKLQAKERDLRNLASELQGSMSTAMSPAHNDIKAANTAAAAALIELASKHGKTIDDEREAVANCIAELVGSASVLPITVDHFAVARVEETTVRGPADALVLVAVLDDAANLPGSDQAIFLTLDSGFDGPAAKKKLSGRRVQTIGQTKWLVDKLKAEGALV